MAFISMCIIIIVEACEILHLCVVIGDMILYRTTKQNDPKAVMSFMEYGPVLFVVVYDNLDDE
jgi:hypothetical protein